MSVTSVKRQWKGWSYKSTANRQETIPVSWLIEVSDRMDGPQTIIPQAASSSWGSEAIIRQYGTYAFGNDSSSFMAAKEVSLERVDGSDLLWIYTATFDNSVDPGQSAENPLDRLPIDEWDYEQFERIAEKNTDDEAITNSAGDPYDPPLTMDDSRPILIYTRNELSYPLAFVTHQDTINSDGFLIFDPYQAKVNIKARKVFEGQYKYYAVSYIFHFRRDGWRRSILNRGTRFKITASDTNSVSLPPDSPPILLDDDGTPLGTGDPTYKEHKLYDEVAFGPLNIVIY